MKNLTLLFAILIFTLSCTPQRNISNQDNDPLIKAQVNEDGEYDLMVIDTQFDYFLNAIARPMSSYSEEFLKSKNRFLVTEWNSLYYSGRNRNVIESSIEYDPTINYGIKYEYKLYQVFEYVKWKYGLRLKGMGY